MTNDERRELIEELRKACLDDPHASFSNGVTKKYTWWFEAAKFFLIPLLTWVFVYYGSFVELKTAFTHLSSTVVDIGKQMDKIEDNLINHMLRSSNGNGVESWRKEKK